MRIATKISALCLLASVAMASRVEAGSIPVQQHNPEACPPKASEQRKACLSAFWQEFRPAMLEEYERWMRFLPHAQKGNELGALNDLGVAMRQGLYVHNHWQYRVVDPEDVAQLQDYERVGDCRAAVIHLKFWLIAVSKGEDDDVSRPGFFDASKKCEQRTRRRAR